jgi:CRP-like cAMP-binding protein
MTAPRSAHPLLSSLSIEGRALVEAHLRPAEHGLGARLSSAGAPVDRVHFVNDGLVAIVSRANEAVPAVGTGLVGAGGLIGVSAVLGVQTAALRDAVALAVTRTMAIDVTALQHILALFPEVRRDLMKYANTRIDETMRLCVCATLHKVEPRIARWLLDATAHHGLRPLNVTHAQLSALLGVRRASVTAGLHRLEGEQAVRCSRGQIEVRDLKALAAHSCGCHTSQTRRRQSQRRTDGQDAFSSASSIERPRD